jgi:hypothetical protein
MPKPDSRAARRRRRSCPKQPLGVALTLHDKYKNPVRWEVRSEPIKVRSDKLWERLSGEADGKALPQNYLLVSCYHSGSALTRSIERSASQTTSLT